MGSAVRRATHLIKSIAHLPTIFSSGRLTKGLKVVRIDILSVHLAQNFLKGLLSAAHVTLFKILPTDTIEVKLAESLANLTGL